MEEQILHELKEMNRTSQESLGLVRQTLKRNKSIARSFIVLGVILGILLAAGDNIADLARNATVPDGPEATPGYDIYLISSLVDEGKFDEAIKNAKVFHAAFPHYDEPMWWLGYSYLSIAELDSALKYTRMADEAYSSEKSRDLVRAVTKRANEDG